jgi:hypothetical protein
MSQKNQARHPSNCQITVEKAALVADGSSANVPSQKRKEDAKRVLYLKRV